MGVPAGWYPDPKQGGAAGGGLRWWDGERWTEHVSTDHAPQPGPAPAPPPGPAPALVPTKPKKRRLWRSIRWGAVGTFLVLAGVAIYAATRQEVEFVDFKSGKIGFVGSTRVDAEQVEEGSDELARRVELLEERAAENADAEDADAELANDPDADVDADVDEPATAEVSGTWSGPNGLRYDIEQYGDQVIVREIHPTYGLTGIGQGTIATNRITMQFEAIDGSRGRAELTFDGDDTLQGTFVNDTYGTVFPAVLQRS